MEKRKRKKGDKTDEKRANKWGKGADKHETTKIQAKFANAPPQIGP